MKPFHFPQANEMAGKMSLFQFIQQRSQGKRMLGIFYYWAGFQHWPVWLPVLIFQNKDPRHFVITI